MARAFHPQFLESLQDRHLTKQGLCEGDPQLSEFPDIAIYLFLCACMYAWLPACMNLYVYVLNLRGPGLRLRNRSVWFSQLQ